MHTLQLLLAGFGEVFKPLDLLMMFIGLLIGMAVSIMPGLGLVMGVVLALPFTYGMALEPSIILLTAIYMSGTYAGCFTAILYRIPGEPMDVPLLWDGYAMTQRGEAANQPRRGSVQIRRWRILDPFIHAHLVEDGDAGIDAVNRRHDRRQQGLLRLRCTDH